MSLSSLLPIAVLIAGGYYLFFMDGLAQVQAMIGEASASLSGATSTYSPYPYPYPMRRTAHYQHKAMNANFATGMGGKFRTQAKFSI